jgi:hypothetical protein
MIITLVLLVSMLALSQQLGLNHVIVLLVSLPVELYAGLLALLLSFRVFQALRRNYSLVRDFSKSVNRLDSRVGNLSARLSELNRGSSPFKNGQKRQASNRAKSTNPSWSHGKRPLDYGLKYNFKAISKKVMDSFFKVISKTGSLVSLDRFVERVKVDNDGDVYFRKIVKNPLLQLSDLFRDLGFRMFGAVFLLKGKYPSRIKQLHAFGTHLYNMRRHHGSTYVVKYLKNCQLAIQKSLAGSKMSSLNEVDTTLMFPSLSSCGLPKFIPIRDRRLMLVNGSPSVIRWWLTLFSVYRVISIPGKLKLSTITDPLTVSKEAVVEVGLEIIKLINTSKFDKDLLMRQAEFLFIEKASPSHSVSWLGLLADVFALAENGQLQTLLDFTDMTGNHRLSAFIRYLHDGLLANDARMSVVRSAFTGHAIGKLSIKHEAAGKERVFAMVDIWTQSVLKPLHTMLFAFLKGLPNDGTFDQNAAVMRCHDKVKIAGGSFGYDLTAATDRLPVILQVMILNFISPGLGSKWRDLLIKRGYVLKKFGTYHYAVGQPMGALSSWAMLAVTHHYLAQLAAHRARAAGGGGGPFWTYGETKFALVSGDTWYTGYEVLGDDIVFFEEDVALQYLSIMEGIGVPINLSKSVIGKNLTFEFAKVTGHYGQNVSAVSWAMFMSQPSIMGRASIAYQFINKQIVTKGVIKFLITMSRQSKYTEGSPNVLFLALGTMFSKAGRLPFFDFLYSVMQKSAGMFNVYQTLLEKANIDTLKQAIVKLVKSPGEKVEVPNPLRKKRGWKTDEFALKQTLATVVMAFLHGSNPIQGDYGTTPKPVIPVDPFKDAVLLARQIVKAPILLIGMPFDGDHLDELDRAGVFSWDPTKYSQMNTYQRFLHNIFCFFLVSLYDKLIMLYSEIMSKENDLTGLTLEELMGLVDKITRYKEVTQLYERGMEKMSGAKTPERDLLDSPLKALEMLLAADDPFGPGQDTGHPSILHSEGMIGYLYALERVENLAPEGVTLIGEQDSKSANLAMYGPLKEAPYNIV